MTAYPSRLLTRTADPAAEPLTLSEAKLYLRVDSSADDTPITALIVSARISAEEYLKRSLITQSWKLALNDGTPCGVSLPRGPVQSVTSVTAYDRAGASTVISASAYYLDAAKETLVFDSPVSSHRVEIVYAAGYGGASAVPQPIKQGMLAHIAQMYDRRGDAEAPLPMESIGLYAPFREVSL